jgi:hypothetical protein
MARCYHAAMPNVSPAGLNREGLIIRFVSGST